MRCQYIDERGAQCTHMAGKNGKFCLSHLVGTVSRSSKKKKKKKRKLAQGKPLPSPSPEVINSPSTSGASSGSLFSEYEIKLEPEPEVEVKPSDKFDSWSNRDITIYVANITNGRVKLNEGMPKEHLVHHALEQESFL